MEKAINIVEEQRGIEYPHPMPRMQILLTPSFWETLSRVISWGQGREHFKTTRFDKDGMHYVYEKPYMNLWKTYINHLDEGGDIDEFFTNLIK